MVNVPAAISTSVILVGRLLSVVVVFEVGVSVSSVQEVNTEEKQRQTNMRLYLGMDYMNVFF